MHYLKFHGHPDDGQRPDLIPKIFIRTEDYITLEIRRDGGPWAPFEPSNGWSIGSRYATKEEAES